MCFVQSGSSFLKCLSGKIGRHWPRLRASALRQDNGVTLSQSTPEGASGPPAALLSMAGHFPPRGPLLSYFLLKNGKGQAASKREPGALSRMPQVLECSSESRLVTHPRCGWISLKYHSHLVPAPVQNLPSLPITCWIKSKCVCCVWRAPGSLFRPTWKPCHFALQAETFLSPKTTLLNPAFFSPSPL